MDYAAVGMAIRRFCTKAAKISRLRKEMQRVAAKLSTSA
jgi:hypothetical protein